MTNRKRGRPVGTQIRDDKPMALVADRIAANPELKPSTAMRQVYASGTWPSTEKTVVTRWLRKWHAAAPAALEAALQRRAVGQRPVALPTAQWPTNTMVMSDEFKSAMAALAQINEPMRQAMAEMAKRLAPTRELVEQMRANLPFPMKEFQAQIAAAAGSLKIFEIKEAIRNIPALRISDAIMSAAAKTCIH